MKKIIITTLLITMLVALSIISFAGNTFSDIPENAWYKANLDYTVNQGIINGYPDGTFKPDANLTRAAFTKTIVYAISGEQKKGLNILQKWYTPYYEKGEEEGILPADYLKLDKEAPITRGEMATIIALVPKLELDMTKSSAAIGDFNNIPESQKAAVLTTYRSGIINGYPDGTFKADETLTRGQLTKIIQLVDTLDKILPFEKALNSDLDIYLGIGYKEWDTKKVDEKLGTMPNWTYEATTIEYEGGLTQIINANPYMLQTPSMDLMYEANTWVAQSTSNTPSTPYYETKGAYGSVSHITIQPMQNLDYNYEPGLAIIAQYLQQFTENPYHVTYKKTITQSQVDEVVAKMREVTEINKLWQAENIVAITPIFDPLYGYSKIPYETLSQPISEYKDSIVKLTEGAYTFYIQPKGGRIIMWIMDTNHPHFNEKEFLDHFEGYVGPAAQFVEFKETIN